MTNSLLEHFLSDLGEKTGGTKQTKLARIAEVVQARYYQEEGKFNDIFRRHKLAILRKRDAGRRSMIGTGDRSAMTRLGIITDLDTGSTTAVMSLVLQVYLNIHARGGVIIDPEYTSEALTPKQIAEAVLARSIPVVSSLVSVAH